MGQLLADPVILMPAAVQTVLGQDQQKDIAVFNFLIQRVVERAGPKTFMIDKNRISQLLQLVMKPPSDIDAAFRR